MIKKERYAIALLSTTLIFVVGVFIGSELLASKTLELQEELQKDFLETQSFELELSIIEKANTTSVCNYIDERLPDIIKKKVELGRRFDVGDIPKEQADILKKQFSVSIARFWIFSEVQAKQCEINEPRVLFFFDDSELSREQGRVLDYLVYQSGENITVFAFDIELREPLIQLLATTFNITTAPSVVMDNQKFEGFHDRDAMADIICGRYNLSFC